MSSDEKKKELEAKILSKRQQIEFERNNIDHEISAAAENRENPDVMEEAKNYHDPATNAVDSADEKALKGAEKDLNALLKQLDEL